MPCESCHVQFTVFRRKRSCSDCKRYYCSNCLSGSKRNAAVIPLCERCAIFAKRPLHRSDLQQLKPKDLIFYLQSKHISTTGCVEKDELVGLVLNHIQQGEEESASYAHSSTRTDADPTNSFDTLKQTCQNFFSNITDNISDSFTAFDGKTTSKSSAHRSRNTTNHNDGSTHIFDQPRVSTREIPTYASFQGSQAPPSQPSAARTPTSSTTNSAPRSQAPSTSPTAAKSSQGHSQTESPIVSFSSSSNASHAALNEEEQQERAQITSYETDDPEVKSDCECSDEELIATFSERTSKRNEISLQSDVGKQQEQQANSSTSAASTSGKQESPSAKANVGEGEASSQSSFEELGAIGGISDDSKGATDTNSNSNMDQWQILDTQRIEVEAATNVLEPEITATEEAAAPDAFQGLQVALRPTTQQNIPQRVKKVTRRRSDGYLNRRRRRPNSDDDDSPTSAGGLLGDQTLHEHSDEGEGDEQIVLSQQPAQRCGNCQRCGKKKFNLRRKVEKMRRHLQSSQMSEADIKKELTEFLAYLEKRTKSLECSDTETVASSLSGANYTPVMPSANAAQYMNDDEGIHVYAATATDGMRDSRFINLEDFDSLEELENLTVKQLKEVLMLNRVDYKGCCEKQELLDRVQRLWKNLKSAPAVDKLQTDELCKICMDAPIECVILECGHMATCTNCGKVLSECPICRQYIVRVVRFFRA